MRPSESLRPSTNSSTPRSRHPCFSGRRRARRPRAGGRRRTRGRPRARSSCSGDGRVRRGARSSLPKARPERRRPRPDLVLNETLQLPPSAGPVLARITRPNAFGEAALLKLLAAPAGTRIVGPVFSIAEPWRMRRVMPNDLRDPAGASALGGPEHDRTSGAYVTGVW